MGKSVDLMACVPRDCWIELFINQYLHPKNDVCLFRQRVYHPVYHFLPGVWRLKKTLAHVIGGIWDEFTAIRVFTQKYETLGGNIIMQQQEVINGIKVVFVEPRGAYSNVFDRMMTMPLLGPLYLGTIAEQAGYDVTILNENLLGREVAPEELQDVDILCVSCMTATVKRGKIIAREYTALRQSLGRPSRTIIGGIHASMLPEDVKEDFDQVFVGEAETKILDVLAGKIQEKIIYGEKLQDLDQIPIPNFQLLQNWEKIKIWPIMTSRGCPFNCTFCSVTEMFGRGYRTKSVERVIEELQTYSHDMFFFVDDHFVVNPKRTRKLLELLHTNGLNIDWSCQVRTEVSKDQELIADMRAAGCTTIHVGLESINQESLEELEKGQSVEDIKRAIKVFRQHRIKVHGMFMLGCDSDQKNIFRATSEFCKGSGLTSVQYLILTPLPGTVLYKQLEQEDRLLHKRWEFYDGMHVVFQPNHFTPLELQQGMIECFSDFYSYANGINDAINIFFETCLTLIKRMYTHVYFPSFTPSFWKIAGKHIVKNWIAHNTSYFRYLRIITMRTKIQTSE